MIPMMENKAAKRTENAMETSFYSLCMERAMWELVFGNQGILVTPTLAN